jgi:probable F420-dependent oxidoreductase
MRAPVRVDRREARDAGGGDAFPQYDPAVHLGIILPNFGAGSSPDGVRAVAEAAEELRFDSVWATEHIIVGPEAVDPYGIVLEPLASLAWIAGFTERVELGTSITLVPLHHPIQLAKEVATAQLLSRRLFRLGVGLGWHEDEFGYLGVDFRGRGRRTDESLRLMKALWAGAREFHGELWSFENATFAPLPERQPEIWVGGATDRAVRRARELGDVWHPSRSGTPERIREVKEQFPDLRVVPRVSAASADELRAKRDVLLAVRCEGIVAGLAGGAEQIVAGMRQLADDR